MAFNQELDGTTMFDLGRPLDPVDRVMSFMQLCYGGEINSKLIDRFADSAIGNPIVEASFLQPSDRNNHSLEIHSWNWIFALAKESNGPSLIAQRIITIPASEARIERNFSVQARGQRHQQSSTNIDLLMAEPQLLDDDLEQL
jgi:hypothetical protein